MVICQDPDPERFAKDHLDPWRKAGVKNRTVASHQMNQVGHDGHGSGRLFLKDFRELQLVSNLISQLQTPVVQDVYPAIL